jgi:hypothetical protein
VRGREQPQILPLRVAQGQDDKSGWLIGTIAGDGGRLAFAGRLGAVVAVAAGTLEEIDEGAKAVVAKVAEHLLRELGDGLIHFGEKGEAAGGDAGEQHAAVLLVALLMDEFEGLETGEKTGDVGVSGDHAVADDGAGEAAGVGSAKNAEDVVLGGGDVPVAGAALHGALQAVGGAGEVEESLLCGAAEGALLGDFGFQATQGGGSGGWCVVRENGTRAAW